ncbi:ceramidase domain-containing protein [Tropicimonas sp. TH_r6]|uniref:ceramidase domain-containing protein n=1 Tax=Tropicimonas sp. TH_r6 TaxID=3082085 RepID=UPI002952F55E|nr:ceramidase domain-containing protein [Tropicimonas sp. TH_r6]MDV7144545.1 ceramidase domain-containing protein [Tropicimonas sp. TH_r6]
MEGLLRQVDGYCERTDFSYWSEPVNAVTNVAFLIAAWLLWRRVRGAELPLATGMCVTLAAIGIGSWLFHTHATIWGAIADTTPIAVFILLYIFAANRDFWTMRLPVALLATAGFFPFAALTIPLFQRLPFFEISAGYWPVPLLIALYAVGLRKRAPATARGLAIGAGLLCLSLFFRSIDMGVCAAVPLGTHFLWHILNGIMLGWMIEVYRRHVTARAKPLSSSCASG